MAHQYDLSRIDHLIYGAPDLQTGIDLIQQKLGIVPASGGQHPDFGTHNALFRIGTGTYFEIIAPDPASALPPERWWMGLADLKAPGLIWWAAKATGLDRARQLAQKAGWTIGQAVAGSRKTTDGTTLNWHLTDPFRVQEGGVLPFLIDWGNGTHPTDSMPESGCELTSFQLLHPRAEKINTYLQSIGIQLEVKDHPIPGLRAGFATANGTIFI
ncbi:VOC family protein [Flavilitoribacter nigricans]|uniref:Glyoxalase-like domain-containing protein n=1 Tax=Flavilitoribacter nigricans (strain ATCC 23147 / DSM 23189 / NBRC 102662 / NCIMB 1420 / SS-2) TaxID=1122177 RepID=A0A2D0NG07_FLAN2|nr:VOC family protein [Flavilitoribacter nigricans]PHN07320.1 hypothetical protein CRP01_06730 [Flavilitoribacter nigricans DSM 23189 = NBRC 102662]